MEKFIRPKVEEWVKKLKTFVWYEVRYLQVYYS